MKKIIIHTDIQGMLWRLHHSNPRKDRETIRSTLAMYLWFFKPVNKLHDK